MKKRFALCVGINDYPGSSNDLSGCVNDALDWQKLLQDNGYWTTRLLDEMATKQQVVTELSRMVEDARFGDRIVFTYSGHGSWVPDGDGDEADGRDECLVLHDFQSAGYLTDDELYTIFNMRRFGVRVTIFSDSCHSGSASRFADLGPVIPGHIMRRPQPRFMPPSLFLRSDQMNAAKRVEHAPVNRAASRPGTVLYSGCDDLEYSYDAWFASRPNGAFTRAALDMFADGATYRAWFNRIRTRLPSDAYPQSPQLTASAWQRTWRL